MIEEQKKNVPCVVFNLQIDIFSFPLHFIRCT
jgi:hypothetical protein